MKILFVQTNYPGFLRDFYNKTKNWQGMPYDRLKKKWTDEWFGTANYYSTSLKRYGWKADEVIINDWNLQSRWATEHGIKVQRKEIPFLKFVPEYIKNTLGIRKWLKKTAFEQVDYYKPDVLYIYDLSVFGIDELRQLKEKVKLLVAQTATVLPPNRQKLREYQLIISSFHHYVERFRKMGVASEYLRWCVEGSIPNKIGNRKRTYPVAYVGAFTPAHSKGNRVLEELAKKVKVEFWGYGENYLSPGSAIRKSFNGNAWGKNMYKIYAQSKIVINRHIDVSGNCANNMRMFEATALGALLITDHKKNMNEFFKIDHEVVIYKDAQDLINKVNYYLNHSKERKMIAKAGQKRTLKDHTYKVRMKELNQILRKYI